MLKNWISQLKRYIKNFIYRFIIFLSLVFPFIIFAKTLAACTICNDWSFVFFIQSFLNSIPVIGSYLLNIIYDDIVINIDHDVYKPINSLMALATGLGSAFGWTFSEFLMPMNMTGPGGNVPGTQEGGNPSGTQGGGNPQGQPQGQPQGNPQGHGLDPITGRYIIDDPTGVRNRPLVDNNGNPTSLQPFASFLANAMDHQRLRVNGSIHLHPEFYDQATLDWMRRYNAQYYPNRTQGYFWNSKKYVNELRRRP